MGTSKAVAVLVEKDLQLKIARGQYLGIFDTNGTPFSEYAKEWLERKKVNVSQSTWRDYKSTLEVHALPHFGRMPLNQIRRRDVEEFLDKLGALSAKRKNNVMVPVKNIFNDAMRREDLRDNPCQLIRRFKEEKPLIDPFSFPEMKAFLDAVEPHYVAYFTTAFLSGMRPNEMLALKWLHVDFEMRCITIREGRVQGIEGPPKTLSSFRDVDMLEPLRQVLLQHRAVSPQDAAYVFRNQHGNPLGVDNLRNKVWYPALKKAGSKNAHDVPDAPHLRILDAIPRRGSALDRADAGAHDAADGVPALREIHPEPRAQGRGPVHARNDGGRARYKCAQVTRRSNCIHKSGRNRKPAPRAGLTNIRKVRWS